MRREVTEAALPSLTFSIVTRHNTQFSMKANILVQDNFVLYKEKSFNNKISSMQRLYILNTNKPMKNPSQSKWPLFWYHYHQENVVIPLDSTVHI